MQVDQEFTDRLPPQNQEAEQSVLSSMLRNNDCINDTLQYLRADDFYTDAHQKIFDTIVNIYNKGGQPVDLVILSEELRKLGHLDDVGGNRYLAVLWDAAPTAANVEYYSRIVRDKSQVRNLIAAGHEILGEAFKQTMPSEEMVAAAERKILEVAQRGITNNLCTLEAAIHETWDTIDKRMQGNEIKASGISTGFADLNELTAGLHPSELVIIAARPSVGKTAFSLGLVRNVITLERQPCFFVSLEQSRIEIAERLLCAQAMVDSHRLRKGNLNTEDMDKLIAAGEILKSAKLFIDDTPQQGMLRIAANARRLKRQHDIKLVVIDYLQLIEPENRRDPRHEQVAQISRRLKFLARELKIPVIALAQVNRSSEDRQDHRPRLSDLRESGSIEQDADAVLMLHRPDRFEPGQHEGIIEVIIAKNRQGPVGEITLAYIKQYLRYEDFKVGTPFDS
jgi:replicative DNA helicase